jgi:CubicO group peptidase (beta-lactamase class C family)
MKVLGHRQSRKPFRVGAMSDPVTGAHFYAEAGLGIDAEQLGRAMALLDGWISQGVLPAAATVITRHGQLVAEGYFGRAWGRGPVVDSQTLWPVASITKPFTATAVMMLVERGLISLDEPLTVLIPEFAGKGDEGFDRATVTLRQALSHCSGLPGFGRENLELRRQFRPLEDFVRSFQKECLLFRPGTLHYYSNVGVLLAAEAVGRSLRGELGEAVPEPRVSECITFIEREILEPLGMSSSSLCPLEEAYDRIAYVIDAEHGDKPWGRNSHYFRRLGLPWGGLFATARDIARFIELFLPGTVTSGAGFAECRGLISDSARRVMTSVQFAPPDAPPELAPDLRDGAAPRIIRSRVPWGIGWAIAESAHGFFGDLNSPASFGHQGATGTMAWGDPTVGVACVLLANRALASGWTDERPRQAMFSSAVLAAMR